MSPATSHYSWTAITIHWLVALSIIVAFSLGFIMTDMKLSPTKLQYYSWHKWLGVTIFALVAMRLIWRLGHKPPPLPADTPAWQLMAANMTHIALYVLMFAIPLTGWLRSVTDGFPVVYLGIVTLPGSPFGINKELAMQFKALHALLNYTMLFLVLVHVAAAIKHHVVDRDVVLWRMLPFLKNPKSGTI